MKKLSIILPILFLAIISLNYEENKEAFVNQTKTYVLSTSKQLQNSLDSLMFETNKNDSIIVDKERILELFKNVRFHFKKIEFISDYMTEDVFKLPIILDEKRFFYVEAFAFHILIDMEALLSEDEISKQDLKNYIKEFQYRNLQFYELINNEMNSAATILEGLRYSIIRIETLNITDFDCETTKNSINDIVANLSSLDTCLKLFRVEEKQSVQHKIDQALDIIQKAKEYLSAYDYHSLDRLYFTKTFVHQIGKLFSEIHKESGVQFNEDIYKVIRAVNLKTDNIYNTDFIYAPFYSMDKNRKITDVEIELGKRLFFDKRLSNDNKMSCATCHQPEKFFTDGLTTSITNKIGEFQERNTPTLLNAVFQRNLFYDMRGKGLEHQITLVVDNHQEFNTSYDTIVARLNEDKYYVDAFKQLYAHEKPINSATINSAISAFQHTLVALNSTFDKYMRNEEKQIATDVKNGYNLFMGKAKCGTCHFAPTFFGNVPPFYSEVESEVLGIPQVWDTLNFVLDKDAGRYNFLKFDFFKNSFKTSTIRNAEHTAPYMHNGSFKTLEEVMDFYNRGGGSAFAEVPNQTLSDEPLNLNQQEIKEVIAFIKSLTDNSLNKISVQK